MNKKKFKKVVSMLVILSAVGILGTGAKENYLINDRLVSNAYSQTAVKQNVNVNNNLEVQDIALSETYGYENATQKNISILNKTVTDIELKDVYVDNDNFLVYSKSGITVPASGTNEECIILAKPNLNAGEYNATLTIVDMNDNKYTANVKLTVAKKKISPGISLQSSWEYGESKVATAIGVEELKPDEYEISYSKKDLDSWTTTVPKTAGDYKARIIIKSDNYTAPQSYVNFTIRKSTKVVKIISNTSSHEYDGTVYKDTGYQVYFDGVLVPDGKLLYDDVVESVKITGSVTDVVDNTPNNNTIDRENVVITNKDSYETIEYENGTISITPITTLIVVTADSDIKGYDGTELTKNSYTYTNDVLIDGDTLVATIIGSQLYVGNSDNIVKAVKVMRGSKNITSNYTFGTHINGTLRVDTNLQRVDVNKNIYVKVGETLTIEQIKERLNCNHSDYYIRYEGGTGGTFDKTTGFTAGNSEGEVHLTAVVPAQDINGDGINEYYETGTSFFITIVEKENVTIGGLTNNQEFTYDGNVKTPDGMIAIEGNKLPVSELEVLYKGIGNTVYNSNIAPKNAGTYEVTYKVPDDNANYIGSVSYTFTIKKAIPNYVLPTNVIGVKGQTLYQLMLSGGFLWTDNNVVLTPGIHKFKAKYIPEDIKNYEVVTDIDITVVVKNKFLLSVLVNGMGGTTDVSILEIVEGEKGKVTFTPNEGYMIDKITVNGEDIQVTNNKLELVMDEHKLVAVTYKKIPFTITVKEVTGASITPNGVVTVNYGEDQEFDIIVNDGYRLIKVLVNGTDKTSEVLINKLTLSNITIDMNLEVIVEKIIYEVVEGSNQKYIIGKSAEARFKIEADYAFFEEAGKVYVDDILVDLSNYNSESGSTIITLKKEFVDMLSVGEHTLRVKFTDGGEAITKFTVIKENAGPVNPSTGDNIVLYSILAATSLLGLTVTIAILCRKKHAN